MFKRIKQIGLTALIAAVLALFFAFGAAAEDVVDDAQSSVADEPSAVESVVEPVETEPVPVETEPVETEPQPAETEAEPPTENAEPATEYVPAETEYTPDETEYVAPVEETQDNNDENNSQSLQDEYIALIEDAQEATNFIAPQMDKSVSSKTYSTDYTAGIVSWICVGTGVVVIIVMLVSTKITGRRASRRRV